MTGITINIHFGTIHADRQAEIRTLSTELQRRIEQAVDEVIEEKMLRVKHDANDEPLTLTASVSIKA